MQCTGHCTALVNEKMSPLLISLLFISIFLLLISPPSELVYKSLVLLVASSLTSLSMMLVVVYVLFSCIHKVLLIMPPHHFYLLHPYSLYLISCLQLFPFMFLTPHLRRKSDYWILSCCLSSFHLSHLILCLWLRMWCGWLLNHFFNKVCTSLFSEAKDSCHLSLITHMVTIIAGMWDSIPNCLARHQVG